MNSTNNIGKRIKIIRKRKNLTLEEIAKRTKFSKSYLSRLERAKNPPPISTLQIIANALGIDMEEFFKKDGIIDEGVGSLDLMKKKEREKESERNNLTFKTLVKSYKNKYMAPFLMEIDEGRTSLYSHDSEEFVYIVSGKVLFHYDGKTFNLEEGDSIYFDSRKKHCFEVKRGKAVLISVNFNYRRF